ncbi:hypothetical protein AVEN_214200-1 [Araneus ventricosus]|uniref:Fibrinogen C-terminal domain-containing protein n=1 Tax=Araneus ventricosus TaxID=182803 RepID=A0A4Y2FTT7_ARAVE|nr:hypothetical protein AVEN_214200-1 [Araneus ventricosus]
MLLSANHLSQANEISKEQLVQGTLVMADDLISKSIAHLQNCDVQGFKTNDSEGYDRSSTLRALDFGRNFIQEVNRTFFPLCNNSKLYDKPADCSEVLANGNTRNGLYSIWPRSRLANGNSVMVYCDMETDGGGWTVSTNFFLLQKPDLRRIVLLSQLALNQPVERICLICTGA